MSTFRADTPLSRALSYLGVTQRALADKMGMKHQSSISKIVKHGTASPVMASRVLDALDPERRVLDERHILYPSRWPDWRPPAQVQAPLE